MPLQFVKKILKRLLFEVKGGEGEVLVARIIISELDFNGRKKIKIALCESSRLRTLAHKSSFNKAIIGFHVKFCSLEVSRDP